MEVGRYPVKPEFFALEFNDKPIAIGLGGRLQESHAGKPRLGRDRRTKGITEGLLELRARPRLKLQVDM